MAPDRKRKGPPSKQPSIAQLRTELTSLKTRVDDIRTTVNKLKDILQVEDNWHSRTSKLVGKRVQVVLDIDIGARTGTLVWTDRYNIGVKDENGEEYIINKGHVVTLKKL